jgi:hypothetical protein
MKLNNEQINKLWSKRKFYLINLHELATMLNCRHEHIANAQIGKDVPSDVYNAVVDWIE